MMMVWLTELEYCELQVQFDPGLKPRLAQVGTHATP